jgi:hypothetical protein
MFIKSLPVLDLNKIVIEIDKILSNMYLINSIEELVAYKKRFDNIKRQMKYTKKADVVDSEVMGRLETKLGRIDNYLYYKELEYKVI